MAQSTLEQKVSRAYVWTTAGNVAKNLAGFSISLVLAHLLGPKEYGLLGMAMVFTNILAFLQDCGIGQAVVYNQEERSGLSLYFTTAAILGGVLTLSLSWWRLSSPRFITSRPSPRLSECLASP